MSLRCHVIARNSFCHTLSHLSSDSFLLLRYKVAQKSLDCLRLGVAGTINVFSHNLCTPYTPVLVCVTFHHLTTIVVRTKCEDRMHRERMEKRRELVWWWVSQVAGWGYVWVGVGGVLPSCIPAHVNYLLFALDKPKARWFSSCNESPESQGRPRSRGEKKAAEIK